MKAKRVLLTGVGLLAAFALWTILIMSVDVQNVGQQGTAVGFAAFNTWFHRLIGVHMWLYVITDWLGLVPIAVCMGFGVLGLTQLIRRRSLFKVDPDIIILGIYYIIVIAAYLIFEMIPINYRPVLIDSFFRSILSVLDNASGAVGHADIGAAGQAQMSEQGKQTYCICLCGIVRGVYGDRQADIGRPLGDRYHRLDFAEHWIV